jgi:hypothetical protein
MGEGRVLLCIEEEWVDVDVDVVDDDDDDAWWHIYSSGLLVLGGIWAFAPRRVDFCNCFRNVKSIHTLFVLIRVSMTMLILHMTVSRP